MTIIFSVFVVVLLIWIIQRLWKMRKILILSSRLKNKYMAWPILGHAKFLGTREDHMKLLQKLGREAIKSEYGLTNAWLGPQYFAMTCDPIIAGVITKTLLEKTYYASKFFHNLLGNGSIIAPVHIWRPRRKILARIFSPKILNGFTEIFVEQSIIMADCLKSRIGEDTFSLWNYMTSYTLDSICKTAFDIDMNAQNQHGHPFVVAFDKYCKLTSARIFNPLLHWDFLYKLLPIYRDLEKYRKIIYNTVNEMIRKKKILLQNENVHTNWSIPHNNNAQHTSFLDLLLKSSSGEDKFSDDEIREELLVLMLAGTDTSAVGACFTIVMLSRHCKVQEKAYEELREIFGDSQRPLNLEDMSKLEYIGAVIKETLRLYPPAPLLDRQNDKDVKLSSEITLPAGSCTCINVWGLHRNPRYWGVDAEEFNPDRFLNGSVRPASAYMPFSNGPRICLGYKYAMMSMKVVVTTMLRHYRVLPPSDFSAEDLRKPLRLEFDIMMKDVDNFKVRLEHRNQLN